jgi:4-diphosphocytidyl-2-C-methyl-D-erythritol kinase
MRRGHPFRRAVRVPSFAKVNLGLEVLALRQDGYHELRTIFQTIDLHDDIELAPRPRDVVVRCNHPLVPRGEENLAFRAARDLQRFARVRSGVSIRIEKRIPVGGGLGGGSSNAAAVLLALDRLWGLGLGPAGLNPLARRLGADVPFFLYGGTALGVARGDEVYPLEKQLRATVIVVDVGVPVSTAAVFRRLDASLTPRENSNTIYRFVSSDLGGVFPLTNDLEEAALEEAPALAAKARRLREILVGAGARLAALSGSGSSYFGVFADGRAARKAQVALAAEGVTALRARTLTRDQYQRDWSRSGSR